MERWLSQFEAEEAPQVKRRTISGFAVTLVDVSGTFRSGMMNARVEPHSGYRMIAAVIEGDGPPWFIKLIGPNETVQKWAQSFQNYVESVRR